MDVTNMKQVTVSWLAENMDNGWRANAIREDLPRAFINVGTIMEAWHEVASVHDPLPDWTVGADGLYTVWLKDENAAPLDLQGEYVAWLDYSDVTHFPPLKDELNTWVAEYPSETSQRAIDIAAKATPDWVKKVLADTSDSILTDAPAPIATFDIHIPGPLGGELEVDTEGKCLVITIYMAHLPSEFFEQLKNLLTVGKVSFEPHFKINEASANG